MEVSALRYPGAAGRYGRSPLLKLQSDERLVAMVRRGNQGAFEVLVARYHARLLSFCRHMVGSREDAEDVLQDVLTASYNAMLADDRPINVRPWLYRIARNRCLNHLRRNRAVGVDSMDIHFAEHGASTADKVHEREEFRQLLHDIRDLPETQRSALVLREMDALSYEQIAEAMETTVSSVKSLLVRARVSLTEAAEARLLSCEEVREELAEIAEGLRRKQSPSVRRHVKNCARCEVFQGEMRKSSRALAALTPIGPLAFFHKLLFAHAATHTASSAGAGVAGAAGAGGAGAAGAGAAGAGAAGAAGGAGSAGLVTAGVGAVATKAAAGIAAAALVTAGTVAIDHGNHLKHVGPSAGALVSRSLSSGLKAAVGGGTRLGGAVGAGPGLSVIVPAAAAKMVHSKRAVHATPAVGSTPPNGSQGTPKVTTATKVVKTDAPARTQTPTVSQPPAPTVVAASALTPTGGAGLSTTPSSSTTSSGASAVLTPTTATGTTAPVGTTTTSTPTTSTPTTSTPTTGTTVVTTTTPTGTTTGTSTSPTGTTTAPTGTATAPVDTTTTPVTDTNPSDTTTGTDTTTTTPVEP
jgi:RNA polymerase sigma factor (sigma-70 family)